jgi:hypothetical protein
VEEKAFQTNLVDPEEGLPTADKVGLGYKVSTHSRDREKVLTRVGPYDYEYEKT